MAPARLPKLHDRASGILLHPTSLPGPSGSDAGDLGPEARRFVDFLAEAGQRWWQMLPVGPTGFGNSPYSAQSAFAGNPNLVSVERLIEDGVLGPKDRPPARRESLAKAFVAVLERGGLTDPDFLRFADEARDWLDDFALYR